jgi:hypothetical protein
MSLDDDPPVDEQYSPKLGARRQTAGSKENEHVHVQSGRSERRLSPEEAEAFRLSPLPAKQSLPWTIGFRGAVFGAVCGSFLLLAAVFRGPISSAHEFRQGFGVIVVFSGMCGLGGCLLGSILEMLGVNE